MAKSANHAPATKADIKLLMDSMSKLFDATERWKNELRDDANRMKDEMKGHVDLAIELVRHDLLDAKKDRVENHEDRLRKLERHAGSMIA